MHKNNWKHEQDLKSYRGLNISAYECVAYKKKVGLRNLL